MKRKFKKILLFILLTLIALGTALLIINFHVKSTTQSMIVTLEEAESFDCDAVLVLGCLVRTDGSPSGMLQDRLDTALSLTKTPIIMSGDHGTKEYDEVNAMRSYAEDMGVPPEHIFMDHAGFCTYDSVYRAKEIFGAERIIIVTQKYHLHRALYIAKALGLEAVGVASDLHLYSGQALREVREIIARNKDFFFSIFKPKPKYLGDKIDLKGDGRVTEG